LIFHQLYISFTSYFTILWFCQLVISSTYDFVKMPFHQHDILQTGFIVNLICCPLFILSACCFVNLPFLKAKIFLREERSSVGHQDGWDVTKLSSLRFKFRYTLTFWCSAKRHADQTLRHQHFDTGHSSGGHFHVFLTFFFQPKILSHFFWGGGPGGGWRGGGIIACGIFWQMKT
jgi:hypothetical protein